MTAPVFRTWQSVRDEVLRRIHGRIWPPGEYIPNEADLAAEFGCARSTVNRALRDVAERGLIDRRRKAGSRVSATPAARAVLTIPVIRTEIEDSGKRSGYRLLLSRQEPAPVAVLAAMRCRADTDLLHVRALHVADERPYVLEDRWIDTTVVPAALTAPFESVSANEWLLRNAPYTHGDIAFSATQATAEVAGLLGCAAGDALIVTDRLTWDATRAVTSVRLTYARGHSLRTQV